MSEWAGGLDDGVDLDSGWYGSIRLPNILIVFEIYKTDGHSETVFRDLT